MLSIKNLHASIDGKKILDGLTLEVKPGEIHAIMGPNGSGKSTLASTLSGKPGYNVDSGSVSFDGKDLFSLEAHERACSGLFLAFQYPVELPGVNNAYFLRAALNAQRRFRGEPEIDAYDFMTSIREKLSLLEMSEDFLKRGVNEAFSGGEKKRNEILQMLLLAPKFALLDETDSGLDIDALQVISKGVNAMASADNGLLMITHYQRLLNHIKPDFVHVLAKGKIIKSGDYRLALELEEKGYGWLGIEDNE